MNSTQQSCCYNQSCLKQQQQSTNISQFQQQKQQNCCSHKVVPDTNVHQNQQCHCSGCAIPQKTIENSLIAERENLRIQLSELQNEYYRDIDEVKKKVIQECELTLEEELREQEVNYGNQLNILNGEISSLQSKLQEKNKKLEGISQDYDIVGRKCQQQHEKIKRQKNKKKILKQQIENLKSQPLLKDQEFSKDRIQQIEQRLQTRWQNERQGLILENESLKKRVQDFQIQVNQIGDLLQDIESFKMIVLKKNEEINNEKLKFVNMEKYFESQIDLLQKRTKNYGDLESTITELKEKLSKQKQKQAEIEAQPQRVEYITVERPTVVEKIVEIVKRVPEETIIRERIAPKQPIIVQECVQDTNDDDLSEIQAKMQRKKEKIVNLKQTIEEQQHEFQILQNQINSLQMQQNQQQHHSQNNNQQLYDQIDNQQQQIADLQNLLLIAQQNQVADVQAREDTRSRIIIKNKNDQSISETLH